MLGIRYMKAAPTVYVLHYKKGRVKREGTGISFFYHAPTSTLVGVSLASADVPFVFNLVTSDFQAVTIQGQLTFRVTDAKRLAGLLDMSIRPDGKHQSDDPEALKQRMIHATQILTQVVVQRMPLSQALMSSGAIVTEVLAGLRNAESVAMLGVGIMELSILAIKPTPEMSKALEAEAREGLQRRSDEAIYSRRNAAVEQERVIKQNELNTEIAVEQQRAALINQRAENDRREADTRAYALETTLKPIRDVDWRTLMASRPPVATPSSPSLWLSGSWPRTPRKLAS